MLDFSHSGYENSFKSQLARGINLFCGAGFSVESRDQSNAPLPLGVGLLDEMRGRFPAIRSYKSLPRACTKLLQTNKEDFHAFLHDRFIVGSYDKRYRVLRELPIHNIYTTNIDDLIIKVYEEGDGTPYLLDRTIYGAEYRLGASEAVAYHPLHGCVRHDKEDYVFGATEIASAYSARGRGNSWSQLAADASGKPLLFWGWNFEDSGPLEAMYGGDRTVDGNLNRWALLYSPDEEEIDYLTSLGFNIIVGDTESMLSYLNDFVEAKRGGVLAASDVDETDDDFSSYCAPANDADLPSFPLRDFYVNYAPRWSHIYSGEVPRTTCFRQVSDAMASGSHVLVIGLRGCGKTTIMMQLLAYYESDVPKHYLIAPTVGEVSSYLGKLGKRRSVLFIDDCFRDTEAIIKVLKQRNVQAVCFDRDYAYEGQVHKMSGYHFKTVDATVVTQEDAQLIVNSIPADLKRDGIGTRYHGKDPTILNLLASNLRSVNFNFLRSFQEKDPEIAKLFLMIAYVHACGTPCSFEMVYSFLQYKGRSWNDVMKDIDRMGALVEELSEDGYPDYDLKWELQDYYQCRSRFFAEKVLDSIPTAVGGRNMTAALFADVLFDFAEYVMPHQICMYDKFKRMAYDADFVVKAMPDTEEGRQYYELCIDRDESEYVYQQAALYFSRMGDYREAFNWIDKARNRSRYFRNYNHFIIDATHAQISFEANIDTDRVQAERALDMLGECCENDRRKYTHYIKYAESCIRLRNAYRDEDYTDRLLQAILYVDRGMDEKSRSLGKRSKEKLANLKKQLSGYPEVAWSDLR